MSSQDQTKRNSLHRFRVGSKLAPATLLGFFICVLLTSCGLMSMKRRFAITVSVTTDEGEKTGNSIIEVAVSKRIRLLPEERSENWSIRGEAVSIDLGGGKLAFWLLEPAGYDSDISQAIVSAFRAQYGLKGRPSEVLRAVGHGACATLPQTSQPLAVEFDDIREPRSIKEYSATEVRILVCETGAPTTKQIANALPWIDRLKGLTLDGQEFTDRRKLSSSVYGYYFIR